MEKQTVKCLQRLIPCVIGLVAALLLLSQGPLSAGETWPQLKFDGRHSGNVPNRTVSVPLGLLGARPLTDAVFTAPVVDGQHVYVVDGSGVAFCFEAATLRPVWQVTTRGGPKNCNNVSSPALAGGYLHFGTMAGVYYVIEAASGKVARLAVGLSDGISKLAAHALLQPVLATPSLRLVCHEGEFEQLLAVQ